MIDLITENPTEPIGSCCDNGRFIFKDCGNWWYNCENWGLQNYTQWIQFGSNGFTMPLGTEHKGRCQYSSDKITCPLPKDCSRKLPKIETEICQEIPNIEKY